MRLPVAKKILNDGSVPEEQQTLVETLGGILNPFMTDTSNIINGNIGFDNFESKLSKFDIKTDAAGNITAKIDVFTGLKRLPYGHICVDIRNTDNLGAIPDVTGVPFLLYTPNNATSIKINKILNLKPNSKYTLTVWFI